MEYTFLTVAHGADWGLLSLQARSMALYCPPDLASDILIVENFDRDARAEWRFRLLNDYGPLAYRVRFVSAADVAEVDPRHDGWWVQQIMKLAAAKLIRSPRYLVLDAKNHLFRPLTRDFLEAADGRPKLNKYGFEHHSLKDALIRTLAYLGVDATPFIPRFTRTSTPYLMISDVSREIVAYLEGREGKSFADAFLDARLTEFFLYAGYLQSRGLLELAYDFSQPYCAQLWKHNCDLNGMRDTLNKAAQPKGGPFLATHRCALEDMEMPARRLLGAFWQAGGLFPTIEAGVRFSVDPNGHLVA